METLEDLHCQRQQDMQVSRDSIILLPEFGSASGNGRRVSVERKYISRFNSLWSISATKEEKYFDKNTNLQCRIEVAFPLGIHRLKDTQ
jgi:hypothetical protein